jgi:hypothetical protein
MTRLPPELSVYVPGWLAVAKSEAKFTIGVPMLFAAPAAANASRKLQFESGDAPL